MKRTVISAVLLALALSLAPAHSQPATPAAAPPPDLAATYRLHLPLLTNGPLPSRSGTQWSPYMEWRLANPSYQGNPYDLIASVSFTHTASGERRSGELFYVGNDTWAFRFTATRAGEWIYRTSSADPDLDSRSGRVIIQAQTGPGFVATAGDKWLRTGSGRAFVPQLVMAASVEQIDDVWISQNIQTFLVDHGFNGFHVLVGCRWFAIATSDCADVATPDPDPQTFARLERLITRTYAAGGVVHLWAWGDEQSGQSPTRWGLNGAEDRRLQRYIAARLGALPGWTMSYGFDVWEWASAAQIESWHSFLTARLGWPHPLGARGRTNELSQISEALDYASYEQHKPSYTTYMNTIAARPTKPAFSEDRFRVRDEGRAKDYTLDETRRGLWHSAMAGGVGNIWGNLSGNRDSDLGSLPYPNAAQIKTYARFFAARFEAGLRPVAGLSNGAAMRRSDGGRYLFYLEQTSSIRMDLRGAQGPLRAVAVDTRRPYAEISLGTLTVGAHTWTAPYASDWAIAVGE